MALKEDVEQDDKQKLTMKFGLNCPTFRPYKTVRLQPVRAAVALSTLCLCNWRCDIRKSLGKSLKKAEWTTGCRSSLVKADSLHCLRHLGIYPDDGRLGLLKSWKAGMFRWKVCARKAPVKGKPRWSDVRKVRGCPHHSTRACRAMAGCGELYCSEDTLVIAVKFDHCCLVRCFMWCFMILWYIMIRLPFYGTVCNDLLPHEWHCHILTQCGFREACRDAHFQQSHNLLCAPWQLGEQRHRT